MSRQAAVLCIAAVMIPCMATSAGAAGSGSIIGWGGRVVGVDLDSGYVSVAAGSTHSLGLKADGSIVAWGNNGNGESMVPVPNSGFTGIAAGGYHSFALHGRVGDLDGDSHVDVIHLLDFTPSFGMAGTDPAQQKEAARPISQVAPPWLSSHSIVSAVLRVACVLCVSAVNSAVAVAFTGNWLLPTGYFPTPIPVPASCRRPRWSPSAARPPVPGPPR